MKQRSIHEQIVDWASKEKSVRALLLIGSRAQVLGNSGVWDKWSDWDFQIVTSHPADFGTPSWMQCAGISAPLAYVQRHGRLAKIRKVSAVLAEGDLDLVILPARLMMLLRFIFELGLADYFPLAKGAIGELSLVLRPGFRLLKGSNRWRRFAQRLADIPPALLDDEALIAIANGYVCDYMSTFSKIQRGEYLAAQRWLHLYLGEANLKLLYEHSSRLSGTLHPDARRIESSLPEEIRNSLSIEASPNRDSLEKSLARSAETFRGLMDKLTRAKWSWPELGSRLR